MVGVQVTGFTASRWLRNWGTAIAAVFAGLLLIPRASEAGCGDYVQFSGRAAAMAHSVPDQSVSMDDSLKKAAGHGVPHRPCQGPGCSNRSYPPQPPAPSVVVSVERYALALAETHSSVICCHYLPADPVDLAMDGFRSSILRPPR